MTTVNTHSTLPVPVRVRRKGESRWRRRRLRIVSDHLGTDLRRARVLADWLDTKFSIAGYRFGLETLIDLVPVAGDSVTLVAGLYPLLIARHHKLGRRVQVQMGLNLLIDWGIGLVPLIGDAFDTVFKAHIRNVRLLEAAAAAHDRP